MSDQAQSPQAAGTEPTLDSIFSNAVKFEQVAGDDDWNDEGKPLPDADDAGQQADAAPPADATKAADQEPPKAQAGLTQEQVLQLLAAQQQYNQQALPQIIAAAVQQSLSALGFQPPAPPAPADPYAGIDPEAPDAEWQRMQIHNRLLQERIDKLEGKWQQTEQTWQQQQQQQQEQARQQQFVGWVNENVSKGADFFFAGWPEGPQTAALKEMAATKLDAEWHRNGYTQEGYTKAISAIRPHIEALKQFRPAVQASNGAPNRAAGAGQRPGQGAAPTAQTQQTWSNPNEFWERGPMSQKAIMARLKGQQ